MTPTFDTPISTAGSRLAVAPMMGYTDRHARYLFRLLAPNTLLYTEMVTTGALEYNDPNRWLAHHNLEHPVALQLGGNDPSALARCAKLGEAAGFCEINLNVGCPSERVQSGCFGARLMLDGELVANAIKSMKDAVSSPVTVKCRIGVDDTDQRAWLNSFVAQLVDAGCDRLIIHARKAWLNGLNPKQNREIPPLRYDRAIKLKRDFPDLALIVNGGINDAVSAAWLAREFDGVMIGRAACDRPEFLFDLEHELGLARDRVTLEATRHRAILAMRDYAVARCAEGTPLAGIVRPMLALFRREPGARHWRRFLSTRARQTNDPDVISEALEHMYPQPGTARDPWPGPGIRAPGFAAAST